MSSCMSANAGCGAERHLVKVRWITSDLQALEIVTFSTELQVEADRLDKAMQWDAAELQVGPTAASHCPLLRQKTRRRSHPFRCYKVRKWKRPCKRPSSNRSRATRQGKLMASTDPERQGQNNQGRRDPPALGGRWVEKRTDLQQRNLDSVWPKWAPFESPRSFSKAPSWPLRSLTDAAPRKSALSMTAGGHQAGRPAARGLL